MLAPRASIFIALSEIAAATESNGLLRFRHLRHCADNSLYVGYAEDVIGGLQNTTLGAPPRGLPITVRSRSLTTKSTEPNSPP